LNDALENCGIDFALSLAFSFSFTLAFSFSFSFAFSFTLAFTLTLAFSLGGSRSALSEDANAFRAVGVNTALWGRWGVTRDDSHHQRRGEHETAVAGGDGCAGWDLGLALRGRLNDRRQTHDMDQEHQHAAEIVHEFSRLDARLHDETDEHDPKDVCETPQARMEGCGEQGAPR
jgi:hypothetical protein